MFVTELVQVPHMRSVLLNQRIVRLSLMNIVEYFRPVWKRACDLSLAVPYCMQFPKEVIALVQYATEQKILVQVRLLRVW